MKLATAQDILDLNVKEAGKKMPADTLDALKLHLEASKRLQDMRAYGIIEALRPLPGETPPGESP